MYNFDSYNVLLSIATNIAVLLMTAFVLQGHIFGNRWRRWFRLEGMSCMCVVTLLTVPAVML